MFEKIGLHAVDELGNLIEFSDSRNLNLKHPDEEFEQTFIYKFVRCVTSVRRENKTH